MKIYFLADASMNSTMNQSTLDLFSPPKSKQHAQSLLFGSGSEDQSSEDEIAANGKSILFSPNKTKRYLSTYFRVLTHV